MYSNSRARERRWAPLAALLLAGSAGAHDADVIYVLLTEAPGGELREVVTLTAGTLSQLAPVDADGDGSLTQADLDARGAAIAAGVWDQMPLFETQPCVRRDERAVLGDGFVELSAQFKCGPGDLRQDFRILRALTTNYRVVLGRQLDGAAGRAFAQGNVQQLLLPRPGPQPAVELGFPAGALSGLIWFDATALWLLLVWLGGTFEAGARRSAVFVAAHLAAALAVSALGLKPQAAAAGLAVAVIAVGGAGTLLLRGQLWQPLVALGLLGGADAVRTAAALATVGRLQVLEFELGHAAGLVVLAAVALPVLRIAGRRWRKPVTIAGAGLVLALTGFSVVQTLRAF